MKKIFAFISVVVQALKPANIHDLDKKIQWLYDHWKWLYGFLAAMPAAQAAAAAQYVATHPIPAGGDIAEEILAGMTQAPAGDASSPAAGTESPPIVSQDERPAVRL